MEIVNHRNTGRPVELLSAFATPQTKASSFSLVFPLYVVSLWAKNTKKRGVFGYIWTGERKGKERKIIIFLQVGFKISSDTLGIGHKVSGFGLSNMDIIDTPISNPSFKPWEEGRNFKEKQLKKSSTHFNDRKNLKGNFEAKLVASRSLETYFESTSFIIFFLLSFEMKQTKAIFSLVSFHFLLEFEQNKITNFVNFLYKVPPRYAQSFLEKVGFHQLPIEVAFAWIREFF